MFREPSVSIIVPVYNDEKNISRLMDSLLLQDYPKELYEIIVIDNNSKDKTKDILKDYPVTVLEETKTQSSYAARNKGIAFAKNKVLAFIDSDCIASNDWLKEGIKALETQKADLVGGKVDFYFSSQKTASECYDSLIHFKFNDTIAQRGVTGAGNLFVRRDIFKTIGLFPTVKSGGDFQWTGKAVKEGYRLVHAPSAIVKHPARKLKFLLEKHKRTGSGKPFIWKSAEGTVFKPSIVLSMLPPNIFELKELIKKEGSKDMESKLFQIWLIKYLCRLCFLTGAVQSIFFILLNGKNIQEFTVQRPHQTKPKEKEEQTFLGSLPTVSVIVPVYNAEESLPKLLDALLSQNYPEDFYEIIMIDNNSKDKSRDILQQYPVILLEEKSSQSSYAARNLGALEASGEIFIFTDSDCIPDPSWIMEGVLTLYREDADLAGGPVEFIFSDNKTPAEIFDSLINLDYTYWKTHNVWATANLFVKKRTFFEVGEFPNVKSGGDMQWTSRAVKKGFHLAFAPQAIVRHPARGLTELLKKSLRIGKGAPAIWRAQDKPLKYAVSKTLISFVPPKFSTLLRKIRERGTPDMNHKIFAVWCVGYLSKITKGFGYLSGFKGYLNGHKNQKTFLEAVAE